jgi:16S rRNA (uracil1498-N3)-methyltransferase
VRRFFVPETAVSGGTATLGADLAHRISRVLRIRKGEHVILVTGGEREYEVELTNLSPKGGAGVVVAEHEPPPEPRVQLVLYQALIKPNRFDLVLEKGTELGVSRFVPTICARTQGQFDEPSASRADRWRRIIVEAAEQCGRGRLPEIAEPVQFETAITAAPGVRLVAYESERGQSFGEHVRSLADVDAVSLFIGPEGGFEDDEIEAANSASAVTLSLGPRPLRAETAAIAACALVLDALG